MHRRFTEEGKGGTVSRDAASYSTWWNGGLRTMAPFHNIIGILTESFGKPEPTRCSSKPTPTRSTPCATDPTAFPWARWRLF